MKKRKHESVQPAPPPLTLEQFLDAERTAKARTGPAAVRFEQTCAKLLRFKASKRASDADLILLFKQECRTSEATDRTVTRLDIDTCPRCQATYIRGSETNVLLCVQCAHAVPFMDATCSNIAFNDDTEYTTSSYRRINHLIEKLNHFQAKETRSVDENEVAIPVMQHLRQQRVACAADIQYGDVRRALKSCGLKKFYDQTMQILGHLTNRPPIRFEMQFQERVLLMFKHIQEPFKRHCPAQRKSFSSYPYILFKFSQLLGATNLLPFFPLLKGGDKLDAQEELFRKICADLHWPFIPVPPEFRPSVPTSKKNKAGNESTLRVCATTCGG